jgi:3-hydroxybutyryl-CoA dehydrogenase
MEHLKNTDPVLLTGYADLIATTAVCLLKAGHQLTVVTPNIAAFRKRLEQYPAVENNSHLAVTDQYTGLQNVKLAIAITHENVNLKKDALQQLAAVVSEDAIIAINTESIGLNVLVCDIANPERLIGLNWTEPVHTTYFLEVIAGANTVAADTIVALAKNNWGKDPYIVKNDGIHSRLVSAMAREASFLVDNGYASVDDIDRACRNDAGYYLPFCGNCRYMDLMGTYAYGMVMKDLNPDLSKDTELPDFMQQILKQGGQGMQNKKGFYNYTAEEVEHWKAVMDKFSYQIQTIIEKYPFNYKN